MPTVTTPDNAPTRAFLPQITGIKKSLKIFAVGVDIVSNSVMLLTVQKHTTPRGQKENTMKTEKTTVKQIRAKAFRSIMDKIDRTCGDAWFMPMDDKRSDFVYEKSSEINRLIYVCFEAGALTIKQRDELKRLNMFVTDSCGKHHGECSSITFDGYYTKR